MNCKSITTHMKDKSDSYSYLQDLIDVIYLYRPKYQFYALQLVHRHVQQSMCCVTYLVQEYVDSYMSDSVKVGFMDIWIMTSTMIDKDHIKDVSHIENIVKQ